MINNTQKDNSKDILKEIIESNTYSTPVKNDCSESSLLFLQTAEKFEDKALYEEEIELYKSNIYKINNKKSSLNETNNSPSYEGEDVCFSEKDLIDSLKLKLDDCYEDGYCEETDDRNYRFFSLIFLIII
jgi:hypothetical protein